MTDYAARLVGSEQAAPIADTAGIFPSPNSFIFE
jgi:hypothetical protein